VKEVITASDAMSVTKDKGVKTNRTANLFLNTETMSPREYTTGGRPQTIDVKKVVCFLAVKHE
jgi:hypothetical protein